MKRAQGPARQRGFGLLESALLVLVVGTAAVTGLLTLKSHQASLTAASETKLLAQADLYLQGFVAGHSRLPCPDTAGDGIENCAGNVQKGRLPYVTLGMEGSMATAGAGVLGYEVQRIAADLTTAIVSNNLFEPVAWADPNYNGHRTLDIHGTGDFCQALTNAAAAPANASAARVGGTASGTGYPVAYALAHPGRQHASDSAASTDFDGLNATIGNAMELPERSSLLGSYDDRVFARTYQQLGLVLDCDRWRTALNSVSMGVSVVEEVESQRTAITLTAGILTTISGVKAIVFAVKTAGSAANLSTASAYMAGAAGTLATAIATCVLLVGCFEIPHAVISVVGAGVAIGASIAGIALNVSAVVASVVAFGITTAAAVAAGNQPGINTVDIGSATTSAKSSWDNAIAETGKAQTKLDTTTTQLAAAQVDGDARWSALLNASHALVAYTNNQGSPTHGTLAVDFLDSEFVAVRNSVDAWKLSEKNQRMADSDLEQATKSAANSNASPSAGTTAQLTQLRTDLAAETDPTRKAEIQAAIDRLNVPLNTADNAGQATQLQAQIGDLTSQIDALNTQILATPVGAPGRDDLVLRRDSLVNQRASVTQQLASISMTVAIATANVTAAQTASATAKAAMNTAYSHALDQFKPAQRRLKYTQCHEVMDDPASTPSTTHTECNNFYLDGLNTTVNGDGPDSITPKLYGLFNTDGSFLIQCLFSGSCPYWQNNGFQQVGVYFKWWDLKGRKTDAQAELADAKTKEADTKRSYETLLGMSTTSAGGLGLNLVWDAPVDTLKKIEQNGAIR